MTGVLQVEAMAQLGGLVMIDPSSEAAKNNFFFGGVDNCKWRRPVVPGDCLVSQTSVCRNSPEITAHVMCLRRHMLMQHNEPLLSRVVCISTS